MQTRDVRLAGVMWKTIDHLHLWGLREQSMAAVAACWIAGTYLGELFTLYAHLSMHCQDAMQGRDLLSLIGGLSSHTSIPHDGVQVGYSPLDRGASRANGVYAPKTFAPSLVRTLFDYCPRSGRIKHVITRL